MMASEFEPWLDAIRQRVKIDIHRAVLRSMGGARHPKAGYVEITCDGADGHDLGHCDGECFVCDSGRTPRCPDCGAAV